MVRQPRHTLVGLCGESVLAHFWHRGPPEVPPANLKYHSDQSESDRIGKVLKILPLGALLVCSPGRKFVPGFVRRRTVLPHSPFGGGVESAWGAADSTEH